MAKSVFVVDIGLGADNSIYLGLNCYFITWFGRLWVRQFGLSQNRGRPCKTIWTHFSLFFNPRPVLTCPVRPAVYSDSSVLGRVRIASSVLGFGLGFGI